MSARRKALQQVLSQKEQRQVSDFTVGLTRFNNRRMIAATKKHTIFEPGDSLLLLSS